MLNLSTALDSVLDNFKIRMKELGYVEGQNIRYVYAGPAGTPDKLPAQAQALMGPEIDLIVAVSTPAVATLKTVTAGTNKRVIFINIFDPIASKFVDSLSHPGGNLTGSRWGVAETKRLEWFVKLAPNVHRLYAPYSPNDGSSKLARDLGQKAAAKLGVQFIFKEVADPTQITQAAHDVPADADAIYLLPDNLMVSKINDFVQSALDHKLPLAAPNSPHVQLGALFSYGFDFNASGRQAARLADQILKGVSPADLPVETTEFFLTVNVATAKAIGLSISDDLLQQADQLYRAIPPAPTAQAPSGTQAATQPAATQAPTQASTATAPDKLATPAATKEAI